MSFTPVTRLSHSIAKTLLEFSKDRDIDVKLLDFELITYQTLMKRPDDDEYLIVEDMTSITKADIANEETSIIQEYSIKIFPLAKTKETIKLSLAVNKLKTKAAITIKEGSHFIKSKTLARDLRNLIWHKKLRAGLYINIFEANLNTQLKKLVTMIPYDKPLHKDVQFTVASGLIPLSPVHAKADKIFENLVEESDSIISGVEKGTLILRYTKTKDGEDGRACNGKYIVAPQPRILNIQPTPDQSIKEVEHEEYIEYFADLDGYVIYESGNLKISQTLKLEGADFKSSGNIDAGESQKDISVHIGHHKSDSEDAIGSGVNIDVKELNVDGSVAANVTIAAQELNIDAQTHRDSKMEVENTANVKLHRGDLTATEANVDVLESGKVTAHKSITIKKMLGGIAIAPIVKVDELLSNSTIIASEYIEILTILGRDNKLVIDPNSIKSYHKKVEKLKEDIKVRTKSLQVEQKSFNEKVKEHASCIKRIQTFQKRIIQAKKSGKEPVKQDVLRIRQYKKDSEAIKAEEIVLKEKSLKIEEVQKELETVYEQDLHAKITTKTAYDGNTKIIFKNMKTLEEVINIPEGLFQDISLQLNEDQERVIRLA